MTTTAGTHKLYGLLARFEDADALVTAAYQVRQAGYTHTDAFSPHPIEDLDEALAIPRTKLPAIVLAAGLLGAGGGYFMQWFAAAVHYPWNIGGRPFHSWPMFIPITFESGILCAGVAAVLAMIVLNGLPMPYHPLFNAPGFERASQDHFFLCIEAEDPKFDLQATRTLLESLGSKEVSEVEG